MPGLTGSSNAAAGGQQSALMDAAKQQLMQQMQQKMMAAGPGVGGNSWDASGRQSQNMGNAMGGGQSLLQPWVQGDPLAAYRNKIMSQ